MEVDLTDDDVIFTTPSSVSNPSKSASKTKEAPPMETIEISDDDDDDEDLISIGKASNQKRKVNSPAATAVQKVTKKRPVVDDHMVISDDDDVIEVVESAQQKQTEKKANRSRDKVVPCTPSSSKTSVSHNRMDVDDVIEVVEPISKGTSKENINAAGKKNLHVRLSADPAAICEHRDKANLSLQAAVGVVQTFSPTRHPLGLKDLLGMPCLNQGSDIVKLVPPTYLAPRMPNKSNDSNFKASGAPVCQATGNNTEGDDVIEILETPPKSVKENQCSEKSLPTQLSIQCPNTGPQNQAKNVSRASDKRYVVDITDENNSQLKKRKESNCLNNLCTSGKDLDMAPMFVVSYYGCKLKSGVHQVCSACFENALNHHEKLSQMLIEKKPLFSCENFFINDIDVVDLDSDEEVSKKEDPLPLSMTNYLQANLGDVLEDMMMKFDVDYQMKEATASLTSKISALELKAQEMDDDYDQMQKEIDKMRYDIYRPHNPILKELPSIDIPVESPSAQFKQPASWPSIPRPFTVPIRGVAVKKVTAYRHPPPRSDGSSQEVVALEQSYSNIPETPLPPAGKLMRPKPRANDIVYVMKMSFFGVWLKGRVIDVINTTAEGAPLPHTLYKVRMEAQGNRKLSIKTVPGKHLAYPNPSVVRLEVGTRVIAVFQDEDSNNPNKGGSYYSGLIAEPLKSNNRYRYLVFFDDGYAQYVPHHKILVVCESSRNVEDDIHPDSREFIRKYLLKYPERPMVKLAPNQSVKTEWNGKWWLAHVVEVDGSLVKMSFDADKRTEWIYRGSTRLAPLYNQLANQQARQSGGVGTISRMRGLGMQRINQPYVEYTQNMGAEDDVSESQARTPSTTVRAVAKKSTAKKNEVPTSPIYSYRSNFFNPDQVGVVKELQLPKDAPMPKRFQSHACGQHCIDWVRYDRIKMCGHNPLSIPLLCGWQREVPKYKKKATIILYTAPCGRRIRNMQELHKYLRVCKSSMSVDLFDFDYWVNALSEFTLQEKLKKNILKEDISYGRENVKIPLVNYVDTSLPNNLIYANERQPFEGVPLNVNKEFLCGCDCTDDCQNKEKCACWQLTIQGSSLYPGGVPDPNVGYYYKRLQERVITGIYECNQQCKCSKTTCLNRVVQHPLQLKLQLFKTVLKGWGLRCINDIPKGTFICIYAGYLYTEQTANKVGEEDGDDYLAELDYIEVVERMKEDYESDVEDDLDDDEETPQKPGKDSENENKRSSWNRNKEESDSDFKSGGRSTGDNNAEDTIRSRLRKRTAADIDSSDKGSRKRESSLDVDDDGSDDDKQERLPSSFTPKPLRKSGKAVQQTVHRFQSVRKFFGPNERVYIMDANKVGNIGRYLNHSCSPNVFVQNVFVDTHDLRFPWVAFFALNYIRAGEELTWDYNYDVGSVPDKQIFCRCGSHECRGRLL